MEVKTTDAVSDEERGAKLDSTTIRKLRVAKVFREYKGRINSMDFNQSGDLLISSAEDDQIVIYDCEKGIQKRALYSKKYGVDLIHFTHASNTAIHTSTKIDDTIRYLSLHDNKYLRYFPGHTKKVTTLCMSPTDDTFLSGSLDKTLRFWDLRSNNCQGLMYLSGTPVASFDPEGLIFAAGINNDQVKLYDLRSYDKGPFASFMFPLEEKGTEWTSMRFSHDGKKLMICTDGCLIRLVDAFEGTPLKSIFAGYNPQKLRFEATFSPDSQFILCGSEDGLIHVWNAETANKVCELNGNHTGAVQCVQFNPKYMMMATACSNMSFWLPQEYDD